MHVYQCSVNVRQSVRNILLRLWNWTSGPRSGFALCIKVSVKPLDVLSENYSQQRLYLLTMQLPAILSAFIFGCIVVQATPLSTAAGHEGPILSKTVRISTFVDSSRIISLNLFATRVGIQHYSRGGFKLRACQPRPPESRGSEGH